MSSKPFDVPDEKGEQAPAMVAAERLAADLARSSPSGSLQATSGDRSFWMNVILNNIPDSIFAKDTGGRFVIANNATAEANGFEKGEDLIGKTDRDLHPTDVANTFQSVELDIMSTGVPLIDIEEYFVDPNGGEHWQQTSKVPIHDGNGLVIGIVGIARDVAERKRAERLIIGQAHLLEMIAKRAPLAEIFAMLIALIEQQLIHIRGSILLLSPDGRKLQHGSAPSLDPEYCKLIDGLAIGPKAGSCGTAAWRRETVIVQDTQTDPLWEDFKDVALSYGLISCWSTPIRSYEGEVLGTFALYSGAAGAPSPLDQELVAMATHIAGIAIERKRAEDRIRFMAHHDALTGLPNRVDFEDRIDLSIRAAMRRERSVTLAYLDLDHFKLVNDSLGHQAGDQLLQIVAQRMQSCVRKSDSVVRLGGDEFAILIADQPRGGQPAIRRLEAIRSAIAAPMSIAGRSLQVSCSMGVAHYPQDGKSANELLANADSAMYRAKHTGRNNLQAFSAEMMTKAQERFLRQEELRGAVARSEFELFYQPQLDLATGRVFAAESLLRWQHPDRGIVSPAEFISLAEETGLIVQIGDWALHAACHQNMVWQKAGLPKIAVSVNVSARQFMEKNWVERVAHALEESGLDARYLELELTESLIMQDVHKAVATMHELEALGVRLAIDDFGTGYSSLSALKSFPVSRLKIDRSFVEGLPADEDDQVIATAIISLARQLKLKVIAEGVETADQVDFLTKSGCDEIQGYFLSRPLPAEQLALFLIGHEKLWAGKLVTAA
ncbi:sensor domain-containing protein [Pararhizobium sp.]|uniref:sensor domain-containing protein n=1 Tax=Pararhizobium sp. TaxID=1977563 RepID=UPI00271B2D69|nr:EAL domain-containing protein [Pararhizobium sp.]MDO9417218.1 EAL domain-containing protein [Pararhizobium sp.]